MNLFRYLKNKIYKSQTKDSNTPTLMDFENLTGNDFEFLIIGVDSIPDDEFDKIMTPNSFDWKKTIKNEWVYYVVDNDEYSYSWEIPGIQFTFNKEVKYLKAKKIADEIIENINEFGQPAELRVIDKSVLYRFDE